MRSDWNNRIKSIKIIWKEGYDFVKDKGVIDIKYKFLGLHSSKIEEFTNEKLKYESNIESIYAEEVIPSNSYHTSTREYVFFHCPASENYTCRAIEVKWKPKK